MVHPTNWKASPEVAAKLTYSVAELVALTGLSRRSIYRAIDRGELKTSKVGSRLLIHADSVATLLGQS